MTLQSPSWSSQAPPSTPRADRGTPAGRPWRVGVRGDDAERRGNVTQLVDRPRVNTRAVCDSDRITTRHARSVLTNPHRHRLRRTLRTFSHSTHSRRRHATHPPRGPFYSCKERRRHRRGPIPEPFSHRDTPQAILRMACPDAQLSSRIAALLPDERYAFQTRQPAFLRVQRTFGRRESSRRSRRRPPPKRCSNRLRAHALLLSRASGMKSPS